MSPRKNALACGSV
jgi:phage portal protein BeeE